MPTPSHPTVVAVAGPNGAGKSTTALGLLRDVLGVAQFINADDIARELTEPDPTLAAIEAGGIMLSRLHDLAQRRESFAFETTMAARSPASWLREWQSAGYEFHILFLWLRSPELAITRVFQRVRMGGHDVPEQVVRDRYRRGLLNFFRLYQPLAKSWRMYDNSIVGRPELIAGGAGPAVELVAQPNLWQQIRQEYGSECQG